MNRRTFAGILIGSAAIPVFGDSAFADVDFIEEDKFTTPVISVRLNVPYADRVIVETFYHATLPISAALVEGILAKTTVIPYIQNARVVAEPVPVKRDKIAWVVLTLVRDVEKMKWTP